MSSVFYTYFVTGADRTPLADLPLNVFDSVRSIITDLRPVGPGEFVGESDLKEMDLQHNFRHAVYGANDVPDGLIWLAPLDLSRDQRWAPEDLATRLDRVRESVGVTVG